MACASSAPRRRPRPSPAATPVAVASEGDARLRRPPRHHSPTTAGPCCGFPRPIDSQDPSSFGAVPSCAPMTNRRPTRTTPSSHRRSPSSPSDESFELPHYSDPPTGQVPQVVDRRGRRGIRQLVGSVSTGPRWRDQEQPFDDADFTDLIDDGPRLGALDEEPRRPDATSSISAATSTTRAGTAKAGEVIPASRREPRRVRRADDVRAAAGRRWWRRGRTARRPQRAGRDRRRRRPRRVWGCCASSSAPSPRPR